VQGLIVNEFFQQMVGCRLDWMSQQLQEKKKVTSGTI